MILLLLVSLTLASAQDKNIGLKLLGNYFGVDELNNAYSKNYYFSVNYVDTWLNARIICKQYGFDLMSLETLAERNNFTAIYKANQALFKGWVMVGGVKSIQGNASSFVWITTGKPINHPITWRPGNPDGGITENCLSFDWVPNTVQFNDCRCGGTSQLQFICEQKFFRGFGKK